MTPDYYRMTTDQDIYHWLATLPEPQIPPPTLFQAYGIFVVGFRYARRCLWKGQTPRDMAADARKAAHTFQRLAELLEDASEKEDTP